MRDVHTFENDSKSASPCSSLPRARPREPTDQRRDQTARACTRATSPGSASLQGDSLNPPGISEIAMFAVVARLKQRQASHLLIPAMPISATRAAGICSTNWQHRCRNQTQLSCRKCHTVSLSHSRSLSTRRTRMIRIGRGQIIVCRGEKNTSNRNQNTGLFNSRISARSQPARPSRRHQRNRQASTCGMASRL